MVDSPLRKFWWYSFIFAIQLHCVLMWPRSTIPALLTNLIKIKQTLPDFKISL